MQGRRDKITVILKKNSWHGHASESLWAIKLGCNYYQIDNIPFYVRGISLGDLVSTEEEGDVLYYREKEESSGHSTYRIFCLDKSYEKFDFFWSLLEKIGCTYEKATENFYGVDVPPTTDIYEAYKILELGEEKGVWDFEEGHCGHELRESAT